MCVSDSGIPFGSVYAEMCTEAADGKGLASKVSASVPCMVPRYRLWWQRWYDSHRREGKRARCVFGIFPFFGVCFLVGECLAVDPHRLESQRLSSPRSPFRHQKNWGLPRFSYMLSVPQLL